MYINSQRLIDSEKFESIDRQKDRQRDTLIYLYTYIDIDTYIYIYIYIYGCIRTESAKCRCMDWAGELDRGLLRCRGQR